MELNTTNSGIIQNPDTINLKTNQDVNVNTTSQNIEFLGIPYGLNGNTTQQTHIFSLDIPESTLRNTLENLISLENVNSLRNYFLERFSNNTGSTNPINERLDYDPDWELEYENIVENGENIVENGENSDENGENTVSNVKLNAIGDGEETVHNSDENNDNDENGGGNEHIGGNSGGNDENSGGNDENGGSYDDNVSSITQTRVSFNSVNTNNSEGDSKFIYSLKEIIKDIWEIFPSSHISDLDNENKYYVNEVFWQYTTKQFHNENERGSDYSNFRFFNALYFPKIFQLVFPNNKIPLFKDEEDILLASESQDDYDDKISEHNIQFIPYMKDHNEDNHIPLFIYRRYDQTKKEEIEKRRNEKTKLVNRKRSRSNNQSNSQSNNQSNSQSNSSNSSNNNMKPKRKRFKSTSTFNKLNKRIQNVKNANNLNVQVNQIKNVIANMNQMNQNL